MYLLDTNVCIQLWHRENALSSSDWARLSGPNDLMIAATARVHDATLVTNNTREFVHAPGLRVTDWQLARSRGRVRLWS